MLSKVCNRNSLAIFNSVSILIQNYQLGLYCMGLNNRLMPEYCKFEWLQKNFIIRRKKAYTTDIIILDFNCFAVGNNKGRRRNVPAWESNPGSLVYKTSALTIQPRQLVWLDRHCNEQCTIQHPYHMSSWLGPINVNIIIMNFRGFLISFFFLNKIKKILIQILKTDLKF